MDGRPWSSLWLILLRSPPEPAAPASSLSGASNHARLHRSICKKRCPQPIEPGKTEYVPRAETHTSSEYCECFTDD